ncbi:MAG: hypothetical protein AB7E72_19180 [Lysobacterales bacterium]
MHLNFSPSTLALLAVVMLGSTAQAADTLQSGVLIAREQQRVLLMTPDSAVEQVSIATGKTEWTSRDGAMPIALEGEQVLVMRDGAERGKLGYALLKASDGSLVARASVDLPAPARGLVEERMGEQFKLIAASDGLRWSHTRQPVQGAQLQVDGFKGGEKSAQASEQHGVLAIDWNQGKLATIAESSVKSSTNTAVEIGQPNANGPRTFRSVSDAYRLQSERLEDGRYRWQLSDAKGSRIGETISEYSYRPFDVVDGRLLYVTAPKISVTGGKSTIDMPTLVAVDLGSGKVAWTREVRDTKYRGPYPS